MVLGACLRREVFALGAVVEGLQTPLQVAALRDVKKRGTNAGTNRALLGNVSASCRCPVLCRGFVFVLPCAGEGLEGRLCESAAFPRVVVERDFVGKVLAGDSFKPFSDGLYHSSRM